MIDPFDFHVGLTDCKALDSCLWELASIQSHHYLSPIRAQGDLFTAPLVKFERVKDFLNQSYASVGFVIL